jgi:hypothetical protein
MSPLSFATSSRSIPGITDRALVDRPDRLGIQFEIQDARLRDLAADSRSAWTHPPLGWMVPKLEVQVEVMGCRFRDGFRVGMLVVPSGTPGVSEGGPEKGSFWGRHEPAGPSENIGPDFLGMKIE